MNPPSSFHECTFLFVPSLVHSRTRYIRIDGYLMISKIINAQKKSIEENVRYSLFRKKSYRRTYPHVRIDVLTVQNLSGTPWLFRTVHILKASVVLGERVGCAILATRLIRVHVHLVLNVSLQQAGHRLVRHPLHMFMGIASPHLSIGIQHNITEQ